MKINYIEPEPVKFNEIPNYKTFLFDGNVYIRISDNSAISICGDTIKEFDVDAPSRPCIVEKVSVRMV